MLHRNYHQWIPHLACAQRGDMAIFSRFGDFKKKLSCIQGSCDVTIVVLNYRQGMQKPPACASRSIGAVKHTCTPAFCKLLWCNVDQFAIQML